MKTSELIGPALDWAVAKCVGRGIEFDDPSDPWITRDGIADQPLHSYTPSTDWAQGGPIIEQKEIGIKRRMPCMYGEQWEAFGSPWAKGAGYNHAYGPSPLVAAMRCFVSSRLGDDIEIPSELIKGI